jgi:hypothetical protein
MTKTAKKVMEKYNKWVADNCIIREEIHPDYDDITCYFDNYDDMIGIQRDENGNVIDAYEE